MEFYTSMDISIILSSSHTLLLYGVPYVFELMQPFDRLRVNVIMFKFLGIGM